MKSLLRKRYVKLSLGFVGGALVGYLYHHFTACSTGTCPLNSTPYIPMFLFGLIGSSFIKTK